MEGVGVGLYGPECVSAGGQFRSIEVLLWGVMRRSIENRRPVTKHGAHGDVACLVGEATVSNLEDRPFNPQAAPYIKGTFGRTWPHVCFHIWRRIDDLIPRRMPSRRNRSGSRLAKVPQLLRAEPLLAVLKPSPHPATAQTKPLRSRSRITTTRIGSVLTCPGKAHEERGGRESSQVTSSGAMTPQGSKPESRRRAEKYGSPPAKRGGAAVEKWGSSHKPCKSGGIPVRRIVALRLTAGVLFAPGSWVRGLLRALLNPHI